jgi:hypothetical protein
VVVEDRLNVLRNVPSVLLNRRQRQRRWLDRDSQSFVPLAHTFQKLVLVFRNYSVGSLHRGHCFQVHSRIFERMELSLEVGKALSFRSLILLHYILGMELMTVVRIYHFGV